MNSVVFPFTITADQLNAADTADQVVLSLPTNSRMVRVPTRLEVERAAGTAYVFSPLGPGGMHREQDHRNSTDDFHKGGTFLVLRSTYTKGDQSVPQDDLFYIPVDGILNQASAVKFLSLPLTDGKTFRTGAVSFVLRTSCPISSGTGSLTCRLYFDEFALPEA
jgi:hypothetical protein